MIMIYQKLIIHFISYIRVDSMKAVLHPAIIVKIVDTKTNDQQNTGYDNTAYPPLQNHTFQIIVFTNLRLERSQTKYCTSYTRILCK